MKFYGYKKCSTCRNAKTFLRNHDVAFEDIEITECPPSVSEFKTAISAGLTLKQLLNTSGESYRALNLKEKLPTVTETDIIALLHQDGKLVKRPFVIKGTKVTVGFKEDAFKKTWL